MKLTDRNNAVHFLLDGDPARYRTVTSRDETIDFINNEFVNMKPLFRPKIQYVCESFKDAFAKASNKLRDLVQEESVKQSGTLIIPITKGASLTIFYDIHSQGGNISKKWLLSGCIIAFATNKNLPEPQLFYCHRIKDSHVVSYSTPELSSEGTALSHAQYVLGLIMLSIFCEVETKIVPAGKKSLHGNEKYVNETELSIEILDSTWFTNIVRSEGFTVGAETGGFFRWQHYGPGLSQKKIIWVPAFEKKGYTRRAGKLTHQDTNRQQATK